MKNKYSQQISDLVNNCCFNPKEVGVELSTDHRYLQQQFFKCSLAFIACLAENYRNGWYDDRNEFAGKCADIMMRELESSELYYKEFEEEQYKKILEKL